MLRPVSLRLRLITLLFWICSKAVCGIQEGNMRFNHLTDFPELANNIIFSIVQDKKGYMWFGTYDGLYKYDGYSLQKFSSSKLNGNAIPTAPVRGLYLDHNNKLWIATDGKGLWEMDLQTEQVLSNKQLAPQLANIERVTDVAGDNKGNIWMATLGYGVVSYNENRKVVKVYKNPALPDFSCIKYNSKGELKAIDITRNIYIYNSRTDKINLAKIQENRLILQFLRDRNKEEDSKQKGKANSETTFPFSNVSDILPYRPIIEDRNGMLWIGNDSGLFSYDKRTGDVKVYLHNFADPYSISGMVIYSLLLDNAGDLWIGTNMGINKINFTQQNFSNFVFSNKDNEQERYIRSVCVDRNGVLWQGTYQGGLQYITQHGQAVRVHLSNVVANIVNTIYEDKKGKIWVGSQQSFYVFDHYKLKLASEVSQQLLHAIDNPVWSFQEDTGGYMWIGAKNALLRTDPSHHKIERFVKDEKSPGAIAGESVWCLFRDREGILWAGTNNGLSRVINSNGKISFYNYVPDESNPFALHAYNIFYIHEDERQQLWLASSDGGLYCFDKSTGRFTNYNEENGLPSNMVCGILEDNKGYLWISTNKGLCVFDPVRKKVVNTYYESDGLFSNQFNFKCCFKDRNGRMYFGGKAGMVSFDPGAIKISRYGPKVLISSFKVGYKDFKSFFLRDSAISLSYPDNNFTIDFSSTDFSNPLKNEFAYKMSGLSDNWIFLGNHHTLNISNLSPGDYTLFLRTRNNESAWNGAKMFEAKITVYPPFWKSWWFRLIYTLTAISLLFFFVRYFIKKRDDQRKKIQMELEILRSQLNPHFIFNSLNSLQTFILTYKNDLALDYVERFAHLMRLILENSRKELISLEEEIEFLQLYFYMESLRSGNKIKFILQKDDKLNSQTVKILPMLVQPFVENSLKHGQLQTQPEGRIEVHFKACNDHYKIIIEDNGIGREQAKTYNERRLYKKQSVGISNIASRLSIINNSSSANKEINIVDLYNEEGKGAGTRIEMNMPYL